MKKVFIIWSTMNQMGFGVEVEEKDYEKAKEIALEGWYQWNNPEEYPDYEQVGYAEPSMILMDEANIKYRILDENEITDPNDPDSFIKGIEVIE
jgi:hypothetical protein